MNIYLILAVVAPAIGWLVFWWFKRRPKQEKNLKSLPVETVKQIENAEIKSNTKSERARIYDNIAGTIYNCEISGETLDKIILDHETLGRKWNRYGEKLYAFNRRLDGSFKPVIPTVDLENPSSFLLGAISHPYIPMNWNAKKQPSFLSKYGGVLLFAGLCFAGVFLYVVK